MVKIDLGCGSRKKEGFLGVDILPMEAVDRICNIGTDPLPFEPDSVDEVHCSHFLEHLTATQRVYLANDLFRVMKVGAKATIITPHWANNRAYGDPTHQWPPVAEMWFFYLNREWRGKEAPHTDKKWWKEGFDCDFDTTWGYSLQSSLYTRNQEYQQFAVNNYKEAAVELHATLIKRA